MGLVIGGVILPVLHETLGDTRFELGNPVLGGIERHIQGRDARAQEVIGAARAHLAQRLRPLRIGERHRVLAAIIVSDDAPVRRNSAAQCRQDPRDQRLPFGRRARSRAAEERTPGALRVILHELAHLIDGLDAAQICFVLRLAPREEPVTAENNAVAARRFADGLAQHEGQLEPWPLPGHPDDLAAVLLVELLELLLAVGAGRERDRPVGMQVIDVRKRQEGMERRVDRRGHAVFAEGAQRVEAHHLVLVLFAAVARDQVFELVHIEDGEAGRPDRREVAAAALDRHDAAQLAGERIGQFELRARIAAAEVRDAEIRAKEIRAIAQQFERLAFERSRLARVPQILEESRFNRRCFRHR